MNLTPKQLKAIGASFVIERDRLERARTQAAIGRFQRRIGTRKFERYRLAAAKLLDAGKANGLAQAYKMAEKASKTKKRGQK